MTERWTVHHAEVLDALSKMEDSSADGALMDVPYGLGSKQPTAEELVAYLTGAELDTKGDFMGAKWTVPSVRVWRELSRVLKPGAHVLSFAGSRTGDLISIGMRAAGFEIRDTLQWLYACLSEDTEVLVDGEWRHWSEAKAGRQALCYDTMEDRFDWRPIEHQHAFWHDDTAIRIRSDSTDQLVTRNHRCLVERGGAYVFQLAEEAARECEARVPVLEDVCRLLKAIPVSYEGAGHAKQNVWREVHSAADFTGSTGIRTRASCRASAGELCVVREDHPASTSLPGSGRDSDLLVPVQRRATGHGLGKTRTQGARCLDRGWESQLSREDVGAKEPSLARRGKATALARKLHRRSLCAVSAMLCSNGAQGWLRYGAPAPCGSSARSTSIATGGCASREPQSSRQPDREPILVCFERGPQAVRGARFTRADLARFEPVHYRGVVWCITVPTGAFVARRNGKVFVTGNSAMPKSLNVSKAIDKRAGAERQVLRANPNARPNIDGTRRAGYSGVQGHDPFITAPATDDAKHWDGQGSSLKPSYEPVILARKPLDGTLVDNVLRWGVGALAIDACRIEYLDEGDKAAAAATSYRACLDQNANRTAYGRFENGPSSLPGYFAKQDLGRWPPNVCIDETVADLLDAQSGNRPGMSGGGQHRSDYGGGGMFGAIDSTRTARNDNGGASRFLFCAKASREERDRGCDHLPVRTAGETVKRKEGSAGTQNGRAGAGRTSGAHNYGPCVKPVSLTRWLASLILPPPHRDGSPRKLLNLYAGTGSEMIGALLAGWDFVEGVEREPRPGVPDAPDYLSILKARVHLAATNPRAYEPFANRKSEKVSDDQIDLFSGVK